MEILDLIITGTGLGVMVIKSYILWFLKPEDLLNDKYVKDIIDKYMKEQSEVINFKEVKKFVILIENDQFTTLVYTRTENAHFLKKLENLKKKILDFYFEQVNQIKDTEIKKVCDVQTTLDKLVLQLIRLRMVIDPEIQISQNIHPVSKIAYVAVKSFWMDDDGVKKRDFTKSLGALEDYGFKKYDKEKVSNDPKVIEESLKRIQPVIYNRYKKCYPD